MRITGGTPNIINGVSRQPPEVRLTSQLEESVNQFPTITRGLVPRNPAVLRGSIPGALPGEALVHLIDRDPSEQYVVTISDTGIQVHDLEGNPQTVNSPHGYQYLSGARKEDLQALTVQDHTFILNKNRVVSKDPARTPPLDKAGLIHIAQGDYFTEYRINVNGGTAAYVYTEGGPYGTEVEARRAERATRPSILARLLVTGDSGHGVEVLPATTSPFLRGSLNGDEWQTDILDNVIFIRNKWGNDFSLAADAGSETKLRAHKGTTASFSSLPKKAVNGFVIKVSGDDDTGYDDYYVRYERGPSDAEGVWKETVAPDVQFRFDPETMPHLLVREANGTFTFKRANWGEREVGDEDTNPWPSFVGQRIEGMSFGNNRVGLHSGESISHSRNGDFFNFWVESILAPLDTDPVDISVSYPEVSTINHVVPFSGEVILFTSSVPFRLVGGSDTLTQKNAHIKHLLSSTVSPKVRPVAAGSHLYFVNDTASGSFVHEFSYDRAVDNMTAQCITDHVAGYIPSNVTAMEADGDLKMLFVHSEDDPTSLYVYKWLWIGNDKAQAAWQRWALPHPVKAMRFYGEELVLVTALTGSREVLSINCHEAWLQGGPCPVYLDRQVERTGAYDPDTHETLFVLPYQSSGVTAVAAGPEVFGHLPTIKSTSGTSVRLDGDWSSAPVRFGFEYPSYGVLSQLLHRSQNNQGAYGNALPGFRTTVTNLRFATGDTAFLGVRLDRDYRKPIDYSFSAALSGTKTGKHGALVLGEIGKNVSILSKSEDFRLTFGNVGPYPYSVLSYGWTGDAQQISY